MRLSFQKGLGIFLFWVGVTIMLNSFTGITGFAVAGDTEILASSAISLVFIVGGLTLFAEANSTNLEGALSKGEEQRIKKAFKEWHGKPTHDQRKILDQYGLEYEQVKKHGRILGLNGCAIVGVSSTPGDYREGKNTASRIIRYLRKNSQKYN